MRDRSIDINQVSLKELKWDTDFFGITCAKAVLNKTLSLPQWDELRKKFSKYQFVSVVNENSVAANAQLIAKDTTAFLADVNIQFTKRVSETNFCSSEITIVKAMGKDDGILNLADFPYSKFKEDPNFAKRGGNDVYRQWLINSFNKPEKFFAVYRGKDNSVKGYLLHSYLGKSCIVELIYSAEKGVGTSLFKTVENAAYKNGCEEINVGTQYKNFAAINFYHKIGCKQVGCHQVYHLWNLN